VPREAGHVALVSQSGNVAVNTLATQRGLRLHTVVSCGNSVGVDPAEWIAALAADEGVGSIAVYLEGDGDGARLCEALARCAERGVGVAVLKVGASSAGAVAAAAHTGAVAGDHRVFRALVEEAGAAWAEDVHELLELAKALAVPGAHPIGGDGDGLAVLTCSGGDSALAADECERIGLRLPPLAPETATRLRELLPDAATVGNPLDYTALIWGEVDTLRDIIVTTAADPAIDQVLVLYDQPAGLDGATDRSWSAVREGIHAGATGSRVPVAVASTLPELLDDEAAARFLAAGIPAIAGLRTGLACTAALRRSPGDPHRLREIGALAGAASGNGARWHAEHEAKQVLRDAGLPVVEGRLVEGEDDAVAALAELGGPVALKLSAAELRHKSELGALVLHLADESALREAHRRLAALAEGGAPAGQEALAAAIAGAAVLIERMAPPGAELLVSARREGVVPNLVVAAGGIWTELLGDAAVIPLPATPERVERAIRSLRAAPLFTGGRGRPELDVAAAARLAAGVGALLIDAGLELIELNPVLVHEEGATVVDALTT
jgi:acetate---CoA ligase (ADP-forming)